MRPIHRWKSFWLGVLIIAFLASAWWNSLHWQTVVHLRQYTVTHAGSGLSLVDLGRPTSRPSWAKYPILRKNEPWSWSRPHIEAPQFVRSTGKPDQLTLYFENIDAGALVLKPRNAAAAHFRNILQLTFPGPHTTGFFPGSWAIYIPHWLLILTFTTIWSSFLLWRSHRMKRLPAGSAEPPARRST